MHVQVQAAQQVPRVLLVLKVALDHPVLRVSLVFPVFPVLPVSRVFLE
ncbi:MAG: hypothetical protein O3B04_05415 [Chloroflexi bacterium]|nr:hypothetical protein [Chloroflexota bacterium]